MRKKLQAFNSMKDAIKEIMPRVKRQWEEDNILFLTKNDIIWRDMDFRFAQMIQIIEMQQEQIDELKRK